MLYGKGRCYAPGVTAPDFEQFPLVSKGNAYEDFEIGTVFTHHWGRTLTDADNTIFSTAFCSWNPLYLNAPYAIEHGHPGPVMNPMLVLCTVVGLSVEDLSERGGAFLGIEDCTFAAPVYAGDTITAASTVISRRESASNPGYGIAAWRTEARNQRGEVVVSYTRTNMVTTRDR